MRESIHKYFQMGLIQWMSFPGEDACAVIKKVACDEFFDAIEVCGFADDPSRTLARRLLEQSHLKVCYGAQPRLLGSKLNPNAIDEGMRKAAEAALLEAVDEAEYLGARGVAFLAGRWEAETKEQALAQLLKTTKNVCDYASGKGMNINLEVFDYDVDKAALIGPAPYAAEFASEMRPVCSNFGLIADLSHFPITHESSEFVVRVLRPYIRHFHIGNAVSQKGCEAYGDQHPRFGFPNGANDTAELLDFFSVLKKNGFLNAETPYVLSFEVKPRDGEDADIIVANTKRVINRAWALLED
jgi:sugar phosphate isomerase/epimerase